jgi:flagellar biosynthesis protein FliR
MRRISSVTSVVMGAEPLLSYATLFGFLFALARISGVFAFLPLAGFRAAPDASRVFLALAFTLLLRPWWSAPAGIEDHLPRILAGIAQEAALGLGIGLALAIALEGFQFAAQQVSLSAGLGYASTVDPTSGADSTVLLATAQITAGLLFYATGADRLLVRALVESMRLAPGDAFVLHPGAASAMGLLAASIFTTGLRLAAPVIGLILLADFSLSVLGRIQTHLHLMSLTIPVKLGAALIVLWLTMSLQPGIFAARMRDWSDFVEGFLRSSR